MARPTKLTPDLTNDICVRIRLGCFPAVAAESCGVGRSTFYRWLHSGRDSRARKMFREFREQVAQAGAEARVLAECKLFKSDPFAWLRSGPGRDDWGDKAEASMLSIVNSVQTVAPPIVNDPLGNMAHAFMAMEAAGLIRITDAGKAAFAAKEEEEENSEDNS